MDNSPEQDLALIRRFMEEGRREVVDRGSHFLIWGGITAIGTVLTYLGVAGPLQLDVGWLWLALLALGWAASLIVGWREGRRARVRTLARGVLSGLWVSTAVTLTLIALAGIVFSDVVHYRALPGLLSIVIAPAVFLTGRLTGERWLHWVAAGWWLGGLAMLLYAGLYTLLLMAAMGVLLMAAPGAVLMARSRRARGAPALER